MTDVDIDKSILNIELGAGCGNFGKIFFPKCYLTDKDENLKNICTNHQIDIFCDAYDLPFESDRFSLIILCNPYGYGFDSNENASKLLTQLTRVLKNDGKILIVSARINKFGDPKRVEKRLQEINLPNIIINVEQIENIDAKTKYKDYRFLRVDGSETVPNQEIILNVQKS